MISKYIKVSSGFKVFPIGIGTWGIGGFDKKDPKNNDEKQIKAISYMLSSGVNFVDLCPWYAEWKSVELFVNAIKDSKTKVNDIFITSSIYPYNNDTLSDVRKELEKLLKMIDRRKTDSIQFTFGGMQKWGMTESVGFIKKLLKEGLTDYVSISNENLETLEILYKEFGEKLISHEIHYSFEVRENETVGLTGFADKHGIINVIFQPLRRNRTAQRNWPLLLELSEKYSRKQNQIILNWLVAKGFLPITKSENIQHIDEHLASLDFELEKKDIERLNNFRIPGYKSPKIDWDRKGVGMAVHNLPNIVDDLIDNINYKR